jgi:hypothetical protein
MYLAVKEMAVFVNAAQGDWSGGKDPAPRSDQPNLVSHDDVALSYSS